MSLPPGHPYFLSKPSDPHLQKVTRALANRAMKVYLQAPAVDPVDRFAKELVRKLLATSKANARAPFLQSKALDALLLKRPHPVAPLVLAATTHLKRSLTAPLTFQIQDGVWWDPIRKLSIVSKRLTQARVFADRVELVIEGGGKRPATLTFTAGQRTPTVDTQSPVNDVHLVWDRSRASGIPGLLLGTNRPEAHPRNDWVPVREACALLVAAVPKWTTSVATSAEYIELVTEADTAWVPRRIAVPSHLRNPLAVAEAILRSEQENRVRSTALLASLGDVDGIATAAGNAMVAAMYTQLVAIGHPRLNGAMLRRRDEVLATLEQQVNTTRVTPSGLSISTGIAAMNTWCKRVPSRSVQHRAVAKSRRMLVVCLGFEDFVYGWLVEHRMVEAGARHGHVVDYLGVDPRKNRDVACELGLTEMPPTVFNGSETRFAEYDETKIKRVLNKLLAENSYDGVFINCRGAILEHLVNHPSQSLRGVPMALWDRHLHHSAVELQAAPTFSNLAAHNVRVFCMMSLKLFPEPANSMAAAGFRDHRIEHIYWPVDMGYLAPQAIPVSDHTEGITIFTGGNSGRDYDTLFEAVTGQPDTVRVATTLPLEAPPNVELLGRLTLSAFARETAEADVLVTTLAHAAGVTGITVIAMAMALGKPCIASHTPAVLQYITPGVDGLTIPEHDTEALKSAIAQLRDPAERARLGKAARLRAQAFSLEGFVARVMGFIEQPEPFTDDTITPELVFPHTPVQPPQDTFHVVIFAWTNGWDRAQMVDLQRGLEARGVTVEITFGIHLPENTSALLSSDPDLVVVNSFGAAREVYEICWRERLPAPKAVKVLDFHMLGRVDELQDLLGRANTRNALGTWWPAHNLSVLSAYPCFKRLYDNAGIPSGAMEFIQIPAVPSDNPVGPLPSKCAYFFGSFGNDRHPEGFREAVALIPTLTHQARFYGSCDKAAMKATGIQAYDGTTFEPFLKIMAHTRFVVVNFTVKENATAGLSLANLAALAGRPVIITDSEPIRDNFPVMKHMLYVPPNNPQALADAIALLDRDDDLVNAMHEEAMKWRADSNHEDWSDLFLAPLLAWNTPL